MPGYKEILLQSRNIPDYWRCIYCNSLCKDPHYLNRSSHSCSPRCCYTCIDSLLSEKESMKCDCGTIIKYSLQFCLDEDSKRAIDSRLIHCEYYENGCEQVESITNIQSHQSSCPFAPLLCDYCKTFFPPRIYKTHLSLKACNYCGREIVECTINDHENNCRAEEINCPVNECPRRIPRHRLISHQWECDYVEVECDLSEYGCKEKFKRKDKLNHNKECALKHVELLKKQVEELKEWKRIMMKNNETKAVENNNNNSMDTDDIKNNNNYTPLSHKKKKKKEEEGSTLKTLKSFFS